MRRRDSHAGFRTRRKPNKRRMEQEVMSASEVCSSPAGCELDSCELNYRSRPPLAHASHQSEAAPVIVHNHIHLGSDFSRRDHEHHRADGCHRGYDADGCHRGNLHGFGQWPPPWGGGLPPWLMFGGANACTQPCAQACPIRGWCGPPIGSAQLGAQLGAPAFTGQCA